MPEIVKPTILKDTREQLGWMFEEDDRFAGTRLEKLDTGDYTIEGLHDFFVIERKGNVSEWAGNITQDRFFDELDRLAKIPHAYILCEFSMRDLLNFPLGSGIPKHKQKFVKVTGKFLLSRTLAFQIKYGVKVLFCDNTILGKQVAMGLFKNILHEYNTINT